MLQQQLFSFTLTLTILATGCGEDHKSTATTTHGETHSGSSGNDTAATTEMTSAGVTTSGTIGETVEPPAAPAELKANILDGGVHVTWKDVADNEDNYILENKADGEADFSVVLEMPFDSVAYHDIDVMAGTAYTYRVKAVNAGGESVSNEVMVQVP